MNETQGIFYLPAAKLGLKLSPGIICLARSKLSPPIFRDLVFCRKFSAQESLTAGICDFVFPDVLAGAVNLCENFKFPKMPVNQAIIDAIENCSRGDRDMGWGAFTSKL